MMMMPVYSGAPWLPKFEGTEGEEKYREWKAQMQGLLSSQEMTEGKKVSIVWGTIGGEAKRQMSVLATGERDTAAKMFAFLDTLYKTTLTLSQVRSLFYSCAQKDGENVQAYILRLRELFCGLQRLDPDAAPSEAVLRDQFLQGLAKGPVQQALRTYARRNPEGDFKTLREEAASLESEYASAPSPAPEIACHAVGPTPASKPPVADSWREELKREIMSDVNAQLRGLATEIVRELRPSLFPADDPARARSPPANRQRQARSRSRSPQRRSPPRQHRGRTEARYVTRARTEWTQDGRPICRQCRGIGHIARNCQGDTQQLN